MPAEWPFDWQRRRRGLGGAPYLSSLGHCRVHGRVVPIGQLGPGTLLGPRVAIGSARSDRSGRHRHPRHRASRMVI